ncbi:MAG: methyltransferase domain-containing protein [Deltaproteobacteria bacterium]|nr:methyltransferase domain-containing protein [Deltaproteobacteria bacterium]
MKTLPWIIEKLRGRSVETEVITRDLIANTYLNGAGIEIGALHNPLRVPGHVRVKYVDRMPAEDLRKHYPELGTHNLVKIDVIDDGERLAGFEDQSQDFVIANHFLEHSQNPIGVVNNQLRVIKSNGILYLAIPDKRYTFDIDRPVTSFEHLVRDFEDGPGWSRRQHFEEWVTLVGKTQGIEEIARRTNQLLEIDYSIHYHVFTASEIMEFFSRLKRYVKYAFETELMFKNNAEVIVILRRV